MWLDAHRRPPAGAVASATLFGAAVSALDHADPEGSWLVGGPAYTLHPAGATFALPVTVTLRYDPDRIPAWVDPATLGLRRWDGTAWHPMHDVAVNVAEGTIAGTTTGFSDVSLYVDLPEITLSPEEGHVNDVQRSVVFVADVDDISTELWHNFTYEWTSTRQSGDIFHTEGNSGHYLATKTLMTPQEELDDVTVTMMAERIFTDDEEPVLHPIGSATVTVLADLDYAIEMSPTFGEAEFGGEEELRLVIRDRNGNQLQDEMEGLHFTWSESGFHGTIGLPLDERTRTNPATYRAHSIDDQEFPAPRVDQISVLVEQRYRVFAGTAFNPNQFEFRFRELGQADAFVRVRVPNPMPATFGTSFTASGSGGCVTAYYQVRKIDGATGYAIMATDFGDQADPFGGTLERSWTGATTDVLDHGNYWRVRLEAGCAQNQFAIDARVAAYHTRYGNARVEVTVTEPD